MKLIPIGGYVAFSGYDPPGSPDGAEIALRQAGYEVMRMPAAFRSRMEFPKDDFLLVTTEIREDRVWDSAVMRHVMNEINAIVDRYGGDLSECGPRGIRGAPFDELFPALGPLSYWQQ
jgi:hypothetical protein